MPGRGIHDLEAEVLLGLGRMVTFRAAEILPERRSDARCMAPWVAKSPVLVSQRPSSQNRRLPRHDRQNICVGRLDARRSVPGSEQGYEVFDLGPVHELEHERWITETRSSRASKSDSPGRKPAR